MNLTTRHEPTAACDDWHCHIHGVDEPPPWYLVCGECGHGYRSEGELLEDFNMQVIAALNEDGGERPIVADPDAIAFCAWCAHDF